MLRIPALESAAAAPFLAALQDRFRGAVWMFLRRAWLLLRAIGFVRGRRVRIARGPSRRPASPGGRAIGLKLSGDEVTAIAEELDLPPLLTMEEAAKVARCAVNTLKRRVSEGDFTRSVKRGKPVLFHRDRFIQDVMRER